MHEIILLSPLGCFTPARGKTVQKNREGSGVKYSKNDNSSTLPRIQILLHIVVVSVPILFFMYFKIKKKTLQFVEY